MQICIIIIITLHWGFVSSSPILQGWKSTTGLSANDYLNLTHPPSICSGGPLHSSAKGAPCRGDRYSLNMGAYFWNVCFRHRVGRHLDLSGSGQGQVVGSCVRSNEPSGSIKARNIVAILESISFSRRNLLRGVSEYNAEESVLYQSVSFLTALILLHTVQ
jgi:hypothetical protein